MAGTPTTDVQIRIAAMARDAINRFKELDATLGRPTAGLKNLNFEFRRLDSIWSLIVVGSGAAMIKTFVGMIGEIQRTQLQIAVFTRDLSQVPGVMDSVLNLAQSVPFTLGEMTQAFVKLKAAGLDPIVDEQGNGPLKDLADAVAAFGGSDEVFKRAGIAIQQMAGKGVISMEELRQQLGEAVPTAMRIMAQQLGMSVSEMIQTVSRGQLEFHKGIDALFKGFHESFGGASTLMVHTIQGQLQAITKNFEQFAKTFTDVGFADVITAMLEKLNGALKKLRENFAVNTNEEAFLAWLQSVAPSVDSVLTQLGRFVDIVVSLAHVMGNLLSIIPPEIAAGGLVGFLIAGRGGAAVGAALAALGDLPVGFARLVDQIIGSIPKELQTAGLVGFLFFGKLGKLFALAIVVQQFMIDIAAFLASRVDAFLAVYPGGILKVLFSGGKTFKSLGDEYKKEADKLFVEIRDKLNQMNPINLAANMDKYVAVGDEAVKRLGLPTKEEAKKSAEEVGHGAFEGFVKGLQPLVDAMRQQREAITKQMKGIEDIGGLNPQQIKVVSRAGSVLQRFQLQADSAGSAIRRVQAQTSQEVAKLNKVIDQLNQSISELPAGSSKVEGLKKELLGVTNLRDQIQNLGDTIVKNLSGDSFQKFTSQAKRMKEQLDIFLRGSTSDFDAMEEAVQRVESRFAGMQLRLDQLKSQVEKNMAVDSDARQAMEMLKKLQDQLNASRNNAIRLAKESVRLKQEEAAADLKRAVQAMGTQALLLTLENSFDKVAIAGVKAQEQIDSFADSIRRKIEDTQKQAAKGLISEEAAAETISNLKTILESVTAQSDEFIQRMKFNASDWGKLMNSVADSMQSAFAKTLNDLAHGTASAKDLLLSFYDDITKAVSDYLAKQALVGIFGQKGGFGQILGNIFGGGGGGIPGFAQGGSFMVGGHAGTDKNVLSINGSPVANVSRGENVSVGQGGNGDTYHITIQAIDSKGVRELFMKEGSALVDALNSRRNLNRGYSA